MGIGYRGMGTQPHIRRSDLVCANCYSLVPKDKHIREVFLGFRYLCGNCGGQADGVVEEKKQ